MTQPPRVLLVGIEPTLVDFTTMPDLDAAKVQAGLDASLVALRARGFDAIWLLVDLGATAADVLATALRAAPYDIVLIGAGIRAIPTQLALFERLMNVFHAHAAPTTKLCFNTRPTDTLDAILRITAS